MPIPYLHVELTGVNAAFARRKKKKNEFLISPLGSFQRTQDYAGYSNIARNVPLFHVINDVPIAINPSRLDEGDGIEATLIGKQAKYHNSCRLMFNNSQAGKSTEQESSFARHIRSD